VLLVSELVTNALLHAGTEVDLAGSVDERGVRIEVSDGSTHLPSPRRYAATSGTGRGLLMLESMVDEWGVVLHEQGKTVWFTLSRPEGRGGTAELDTPAGAAPDDSAVEVELRNLPLLLHAAWQEHAEALLREYLLANLDSDEADSIQRHADATDAIAVLGEHVPRASVAMTPGELMNDATEPRVTAPRVGIPVPTASVANFRTLDQAIEAALDLSEQGLVLAPPTQPEVQAFRRWICRQVLRQADGAEPEPWVVPDGDHEPLDYPPDWDPSSVTNAVAGLVAADHSNRILAVSRAASELLGYDDQAELVGKRIVTIIPERFRQAHVAGFTMYLLVGRKPLLDRPVVVPALRRDGSEVEVEMTVRDQPLGNGKAVLLADLRAADG
jgi:PAS domain S-box-containing protein